MKLKFYNIIENTQLIRLRKMFLTRPLVHRCSIYFLLWVLLCASELGWPSPSALWPRGPVAPLAQWPSGSGLSICLPLSGSSGTGALEDPRTPLKATPTKHPHQPPGQLLWPGNLHSAARWAPGHAVGPRRVHTEEHTHTHTIPTHMVRKPLYK